MSHSLVDNGIIQSVPRSPEVQTAVSAILDAENDLCCSALPLDEFGFSARLAVNHADGLRRVRTSFLYLPASPEIDEIALDIRSALWRAGKGRAVGLMTWPLPTQRCSSTLWSCITRAILITSPT